MLLEVCIGIWFIVVAGVRLFLANHNELNTQHGIEVTLEPISFFLTSAFQITMTIQLFNWFSKRMLGCVLGLWFAFQTFGLMTKFLVCGIWDYFPNLYQAELHVGPSLLKKEAYLQFSVAAAFLLLALVDQFYFVFHPFEVAIVVDLEEKNEYDRKLLRKLAVQTELNRQDGIHEN